MSDGLLFYLFAAVTVGSSLLVIGQPNPIHSVILLIASFGGLSALYVLLDAPFVAVIQIIIYAGAIMVLFLFVIMLLNAPSEDLPGKGPRGSNGVRLLGAALSAVLVAELWWAITRSRSTVAAGADAEGIDSVAAIGRSLYTDYAFAFEVTSVLILTAMLGAVVLARRESASDRAQAARDAEAEALADARRAGPEVRAQEPGA